MSHHGACTRVAVAASLALLGATGRAQVDIEWAKVFDSGAANDDVGRHCAVDGAGNVYIAGVRDDVQSILLAKYSPTGVELWRTDYTPAGPLDLSAVFEFELAPNGDLYVLSAVSALTSAPVLWKFTNAGTFAWARAVTGAGNQRVYALAVDSASRAIVGGYAHNPATGGDAAIRSYSPAGALLWSKELDGGVGGDDAARELAVLPGGEIVAVGTTRAAVGRGDFGVWKLDAAGALLWSRAIDGGANLFDDAYALGVSPAGKLLVAGTRRLTLADVGWLVVQLDAASGAIEWTAGHTQPEDGLVAVEAGRNGEWWVSGVHTHYPSGPIHSEIVLRRFDASGALVSSTSWSGFPPSPGSSEYSYPAGMVVGTAGQAWVLGNSSSTLMSTGFNQRESALLLLGPDGALSWSESLTASLGPDAGVGDLQRCPSDRLAAVGVVLPTSPSFHSDILTTQFDVSDSPQAYCTAKTTSAGCVPATSFTGMPSASASSGFVVSCSQVRNQKNGLVFYGVNGSANLPFQGGTLCVAVPQVRTPIQSSGGNPSPADDCSGSFALDMNAYASGALGGAPLPALSVAGTTVHCQFWGRDPGFAPPQNTMLSNGLRYVVLP